MNSTPTSASGASFQLHCLSAATSASLTISPLTFLPMMKSCPSTRMLWGFRRTRIYKDKGFEVWAKPLADSSLAVGMFFTGLDSPVDAFNWEGGMPKRTLSFKLVRSWHKRGIQSPGSMEAEGYRAVFECLYSRSAVSWCGAGETVEIEFQIPSTKFQTDSRTQISDPNLF